MFEKALFIFRRDLRIQDNTGLLYSLISAKKVICAFIFTPEQIKSNPYRSDHCLQFMIESLEDLEEELKKKGGKLFYFFESSEKIVSKCIQEEGVDLVVVNRDYTPYSIKRDEHIEKECNRLGACFESFDDALLHRPEDLLNQSGSPYRVFTPFYRNALKIEVQPPRVNRYTNYCTKSISFAENSSPLKEILPKRKKIQKGGRLEGIKILKKIESFSKYEKERDFPALNGTTHLSPHLKFTTVSPREAYQAITKSFGKNSSLAQQLYWRDFFTSISLFYPHIFKGAFNEKFNKLQWKTDHLNQWKEGRTGFPIVDAGMRELKETGNMHNRVRMIVGSFLVKDLHISWREGEKHFAQHLVDYDPAVNNGNWQWVASTGCDAQPYFRIFNPWRQQLKFDPDCEYIKKWIPELAKEDPKTIHNWDKKEKETDYPLPIVDHSIESKKTLENYKSC